MTGLSRAVAGKPVAPVRIVHLGLGAFHRAHQAWYTGAVSDDWGIAAFTGRSSEAAEVLTRQDGLYTLVERGRDSDTSTVVSSIAEAVDGARVDRLVQLIEAESTALVTLTVTEAGYRLLADGQPDEGDPVMAADLAGEPPRSPLGRLVLALEARRRQGAPIAIVPCDNLPANGAFVRAGMLALAERRDSGLATWIDQNVSFVSTSVDRITPRLAPADRDIAERLGVWTDEAPVITEPFTDWILSGTFPAGRPDWEAAGASFVSHITPFEHRKLWLLNGAHSLLAYLGTMRGFDVVSNAISDPICRTSVLQFWWEARRTLSDESLGVDEYCAALLRRFENARIRHELAQIATDGATKLRLRVVPTARAERSAGRDAPGSVTVIAAWIATIRSGRYGADSEGVAITAAAGDVRALVRILDSDLADDSALITAVTLELSSLLKESP
ncbi:mannitol dehydrogenase family protein [Microcella sp.]|uniref:mannitol dehydrogenase family protein n=1 Tax=Microcella sp. TaxID=1913979 RepID=UPI0025618EB0|nr:mannitol dehydrogenase family protein [Microcella sp.]MBX9471680.1 mannitol dehydrogenase family protein [Microcella sp.]